MLRSCKGNVRLAWPFIEALSDVPLANRHFVSARAITTTSGVLESTVTTKRPSFGLGTGTRWSDCRLRRNKPAGHSRSEGSTSGLAPRPARQEVRRYASVALAVRDESEASHMDAPTRHSRQSSQHVFPLSTSSRKAMSHTGNSEDRRRQATGSLKKPKDSFVPEYPSVNDLSRILNNWILGTSGRNMETVSVWVDNLLKSMLTHQPAIKKNERLRLKVVNRLNHFAQAVIDRNLLDARENNGLPSKVAVRRRPRSSGIDWRTSKRSVQLMAQVMIKLDMFAAMEEMIYVFGAAHKATSIDLSQSLTTLISKQRWSEVLKYAETAKRKNAQDPAITILQMRALNELRRHDEVIRLSSPGAKPSSDAKQAGLEVRQETRDIAFLCERMRAHLALKHVLPAMQIRERLWSMGWQTGHQAGYTIALAAGIRSAGHLPEIEERILVDELDVLQGEERRRVLDALAYVRVAIHSRIRHLLPYYGLGKDDWRQTLTYLMESATTVEWMLGSKEIAGDMDSMSALWDRYLDERRQRVELVPPSILAAYVKACVRLKRPRVALLRLEEISHPEPDGSSRFEIDVTVLSPLLAALTRLEGSAGAQSILDFAVRLGVRLDRKAARKMVAALLEHYAIFTPQHEAYLVALVETICGADTPKRAALTSALNSQDRAVIFDRRSLQEIAKADQAETSTREGANEEAVEEDTALNRYHRYLRTNDRITMMRPRDFYEAMLQHGVAVDSNRFTEIMRIYLESKDIGSAVEAFDLARLVGVKPGFHMWVTLLWGTMRYGGFKFCQRLLYNLRVDGLRPDAAAWATVGAALIRGGQYRQSKEFCDLGIKKLDLAKIDTVLVSVCFNARCRAGKPQEAIDLLKRFEASGQVVIDKPLRESIKRFHDWHKKQDRPDAATLAANFAALIGDGAARSQLASEQQAQFVEVKRWLRPTLRKYWLQLPDVVPSDILAKGNQQQEIGTDLNDITKEKPDETRADTKEMVAEDISA